MDKKQKEKIAINAANTWCRCFKCDGIIRDSNDKCDKNKLLTCHQWYHGYRAALLALDDYEQQMMKDATDVTVHIDAGNYPYIPQLELYDYDNDIALAKEGDKYKVVLIKE